jgi:hypothetical protein
VVFDRRVNAGMRRQPLRAEIAPLLAQRGLLVQSTIAHRNLKFAQATVVTTKGVAGRCGGTERKSAARN